MEAAADVVGLEAVVFGGVRATTVVLDLQLQWFVKLGSLGNPKP